MSKVRSTESESSHSRKSTSRKGAVKFVSQHKSTFYATLKKRVDEYFTSNNLSRFGNKTLVVKTIVLLCMYTLPFGILLYFQPGFGISLALWMVMGLGIAGLGMSVMHDGNHGSYSSSKLVNYVMGHVLNIMGGSTYNWKLQHNLLHHTYTNIDQMDDDIASKPALRLCPHAPVKKAQRYQWIHGFFLYSLTTLFWVTAKDFIQYARYKKSGVSAASKSGNNWILFKMVLLKILYFTTFIIVPVTLFAIPFWQVITGFIVMHLVAGLILTVVFQLAHSLEGTHHPLPNKLGIIENEWAIHQMNTTMNFAPKNKFLSWYVGGLNFQVEHHLFPGISHVHYPHIATIVQLTAAEYRIPYLQHNTMTAALKAHVRFLKKLGKLPNPEEVFG